MILKSKIKRWIEPLFFLGHGEKTQYTLLLNASLNIVFIITTFVLIGNLAGGKTPAIALYIDGIILLIWLLLRVLMIQGKIILSSIGLVTLALAMVTVSAISLGTIRTPTTSYYLLAIIWAGLFFRLRGLLATTAVSSIAVSGLIYAENNGLLPTPIYEVNITQWVTYTSLFGLCGLLSYLAHQSIRSAMEQQRLEITERKLGENQLKILLKEKETLLKEIHHRVKNNMYVVSSLLSLHKNSTENEEVKKALQESQGRIYAMSAVHESLYNSANMAEIDLTEYLNKLATSLLQTYSVNPGRVSLKIGGDEVKVNTDKASPLGLAINELISNAVKYAFPDDRKGKIEIITRKRDELLELTIKDDGVGFPEGFDWKNSSTLGLKLVRSLVENQLRGSIEIDRKPGTQFKIQIKLD